MILILLNKLLVSVPDVKRARWRPRPQTRCWYCRDQRRAVHSWKTPRSDLPHYTHHALPASQADILRSMLSAICRPPDVIRKHYILQLCFCQPIS